MYDPSMVNILKDNLNLAVQLIFEKDQGQE